jgi:hypothetical protein
LQCVGYWIRSLTSEQTAHPSHLHGVLRFQRAFSLLESNLVSVGVLPPTTVRASGSLELGTA